MVSKGESLDTSSRVSGCRAEDVAAHRRAPTNRVDVKPLKPLNGLVRPPKDNIVDLAKALVAGVGKLNAREK